MQKNKTTVALTIVLCMLFLNACSFEKLQTNKLNDIDFTVVAESELPTEVSSIIEERKENAFQVTYTDKENTYIIIGYGKQKYEGYQIQVKELYETDNAVYVRTEFEGPKEYTTHEVATYPYIVIKIEYTDKNVIFHE